MKHRSHVGHGGQGASGGRVSAVGPLVPKAVGANHAEAEAVGDVGSGLDVAVGVDVAEGASHVAVGVAALMAGGVAGVVSEGVLSELVLGVVLGRRRCQWHGSVMSHGDIGGRWRNRSVDGDGSSWSVRDYGEGTITES